MRNTYLNTYNTTWRKAAWWSLHEVPIIIIWRHDMNFLMTFQSSLKVTEIWPWNGCTAVVFSRLCHIQEIRHRWFLIIGLKGKRKTLSFTLTIKLWLKTDYDYDHKINHFLTHALSKKITLTLKKRNMKMAGWLLLDRKGPEALAGLS